LVFENILEFLDNLESKHLQILFGHFERFEKWLKNNNVKTLVNKPLKKI